MEKQMICVAAHRGNSILFPENTMPAYRSALELPIDQIEIDLHMTKDGRIVMIHDHTVDKTTNGTGLVRNMTAAEIRALDAGSWKGRQFAGERVPFFEEFLELMQDHPRMTVNVELKDYPEPGDEEWAWKSADTAIALLERYGMHDRIWLNSWSAPLLEYIDAKYAHAYRLHGYYPFDHFKGKITRDPYEYLHCACLWGPADDPVRPMEDFDYTRSRGVEPWVFARRDEKEQYDLFIQRGAKLITTNDPKTCVEYLQKAGCHEKPADR